MKAKIDTPRAKNGRFRPYGKGERYAAQLRLLYGDPEVAAPEPFPIAEYLLALLGLAAISTLIGLVIP